MNKEVEERFNNLISRDNIHKSNERLAFLFIMAGNIDLYSKIDYIYDFENHWIKPDCFDNENVDFCSSSRDLIRLAFNLYNGFSTTSSDVLSIFCNLDDDNFDIAINAIKIRFNRYDF